MFDEIGTAGRPGIVRIAASIPAGGCVLILGSSVTRSSSSAHGLDGYAPRETIAAALISPTAC
ncbi:hypothetical protein [Sphingomonas sp. PP-CE-1G-424]|uniref:hypothetical protein n=1 Tax=Sphingomonas sp. PP-CE-1G-424 TaxID=2135658 RepID=UPI0010549E97|nr:hypothetical protein [Sphingomonas sp. PP-CE-1G-424]